MELTDNRLFSNRQLLRLIVPLVIEQAMNILVGMADGVMVSTAGEAAISGVSLVDMINTVVLTLFMGLATGGAVVTSQYLGARKYDDAQKSVGQLTMMAAVIGIMVFLVIAVFSLIVYNNTGSVKHEEDFG
jgi:Na+-driven multidrug efflux pump